MRAKHGSRAGRRVAWAIISAATSWFGVTSVAFADDAWFADSIADSASSRETGGGRVRPERPAVFGSAPIAPSVVDHDDGYVYRLPYADGESYPVIQAYGARLSHRGAEYYTVDFGMPVGTPVLAAREGVVVLVEDGHDGACWREGCERLANYVVVLHSDGTTGQYFHLQRGSAQIGVGQVVARGQRLARSGNTGYSNAPHLHFGVYHAELDGTSTALPVRFLTRNGSITTPRSGAYYLNPSP